MAKETRHDKRAGKKFETKRICSMNGEESELLVAYQMDQGGAHRLCLVDSSGKEITAGAYATYEFPCFMTIGAQRLVAFSNCFEGSVETCVVFKLDRGRKRIAKRKSS